MSNQSGHVCHSAGTKYTTITLDLLPITGCLLVVIAELDRRPTIGAGHLAYQTDRLHGSRITRMTSDEIVGQVGAKTKAHAHLALEVGMDGRNV